MLLPAKEKAARGVCSTADLLNNSYSGIVNLLQFKFQPWWVEKELCRDTYWVYEIEILLI